MAKQAKKPRKVNIVNRQARHEYLFLDEYEAGIVLTGTEIKSIRDSNANLKEAYCVIEDGEIYVKALHIAEYNYGTYNNHVTKRDRKLLLRKKEIKKMLRKVTEKGMSIVPTRLFISERGYAKLDIAVAKGKKEYDKRESMKERDSKRDLDRIKKQYRTS